MKTFNPLRDVKQEMRNILRRIQNQVEQHVSELDGDIPLRPLQRGNEAFEQHCLGFTLFSRGMRAYERLPQG